MKGIIDIKPNRILFLFICIFLLASLLGDLLDFKEVVSSTLFIVLGSAVAISGFILHMICHKYHKFGHDTSDKIKTVIADGIYKKIRHPMYSGILLIVWGIFIAWNFYFTLPIPIVITVLLYSLAKKEEQYLIETLDGQYKEYIKEVKWMFIPGLL